MSELVIGCEMDNCGQFIWTSIRELRVTKKGKYKIKVISDPNSYFEWNDITGKDFDGLNKSEMIKKFKNACLAIHTCEGEYSLEYLKENGYDIRFYY